MIGSSAIMNGIQGVDSNFRPIWIKFGKKEIKDFEYRVPGLPWI